MSRRSRLISWLKDEQLTRVMVTWTAPLCAAGTITWAAGLGISWLVLLSVSLLIAAKWLWQLRDDIRDTYRHALVHADHGMGAGTPAAEPRYVALRFKRRLSPGIWAVVIYKGDNIRVYQGLGKIPAPPGRAEKTRFARQVA